MAIFSSNHKGTVQDGLQVELGLHIIMNINDIFRSIHPNQNTDDPLFLLDLHVDKMKVVIT